MVKILIVDDDKKVCLLLSELTKKYSNHTHCVHSLEEAINISDSEDFDLILLDLELPDGKSLSILPKLISAPSSPEVIIITGTGSVQGAEIAFKHGAWDFITKPVNHNEFTLTMTRALQYRSEKQAVKKPRLLSLSRKEIIGESSSLKASLELVAQAAVTETGVLITGETGTGKELIARAIHQNSQRATGRFIVVDCASLPESLIESALFGHEKGSFTGATTSRPGLIKQAEKGTLFLDEIGELPPSVQKTFLRVIQERCFRPVGSDCEVESDFRLVAATHRNLGEMVDKGDFRKDLLYRLQPIEIHLPPLRERREDITSIVVNHLKQKSTTNSIASKGYSPEFIQTLQAFDWPGNIRELLNVIDHALATAGESPTLHPIHLPTQLRLPQLKSQLIDEQTSQPKPQLSFSNYETLPVLNEYRDFMLESLEKAYLLELMCRTQGEIKAACEVSGLSMSRLYALLKKYTIPRS